jgi:hypothetical protein
MRSQSDGLLQLAARLRERAGRGGLVAVEVGSYAGESMEIFARSGTVGTIACVDPWMVGYDPRDIASSSCMAMAERNFDARAGTMRDSLGVKVLKHRGTIDTFIASPEFRFVAGRVDFAYIDGCHEYGSVRHDIEVVRKVVKPRLAICGHDYGGGWHGVVRAVDEAFGKPDFTFPDGSWAVFEAIEYGGAQ